MRLSSRPQLGPPAAPKVPGRFAVDRVCSNPVPLQLPRVRPPVTQAVRGGSLIGFDDPLPAHPEQARNAKIDLVNQRQIRLGEGAAVGTRAS
jgi:hypothetical protein